jgi:DHA3 family macrolide efflux protein-like MFS transporter
VSRKLPQVLQIKAFRDLWLGQSISQLGDAFYFVTFMFMAEKLTGRIEMVGLVGALEAIPYILFSAYAGILADRLDRRRIMWLSDVASGIALVLFGLVLVFQANPPPVMLLVMSFVTSTIRCFFLPAKSAAIPNLIPADRVLEANAFSMTTQSMMPLIGLAFSASIMAPLYATSPRWFFLTCVLVNSISFFGSAAFIARLPKIVPDRKVTDEAHPLADFKLGWKYVSGRRELVILIAMLTVFRLFVSPFFVVHVAANKMWFGGKPSTLAWFEFSFFAGLIVMSPVVGKLKIQRPTITFALGLGAVGLFVALMSFSNVLWLYILWNVACGLVLPFADIPINAYMQLSVPDELRGRVNAVISMLGMGIMPVGMVLAGMMVDRFGLVFAFLVMGIGMFLAALIGPLDKAYRDARMPEMTKAESPSEPLLEAAG